jgi:hypothetical protein
MHLNAFEGIFNFLTGSSASNAISGLMEGVGGDQTRAARPLSTQPKNGN